MQIAKDILTENPCKLKLELISLTGGSKIIVYILFVVPILFVTFISIIDPEYFKPLLTTPLGLAITAVILVVYVIYIFVIRKIILRDRKGVNTDERGSGRIKRRGNCIHIIV